MEFFFKLLLVVILMLIAFRNISPYKFNIKEYIIMGLTIGLIYIPLFLFDPRLASIAQYFTPVFFLYKKSKKIIRSFMLQIFICLVVSLIDNFTELMFLKIFGRGFLSSTLGYYITFSVISLMVYFFSKFVGKLLISNNFIFENNNSKCFILINIMLVLTFVFFYVIVNWIDFSDGVYISELHGILIAAYGSIMIIICISLFFISKREEKFKYKQIQLDNLEQYTNNLENLYMDMRKFRHDYINIISSMAAFIEERDIDGLEEHFNKNIYPLNNKMNKNNYKLGLLKNIKLPQIKGLLSGKVIHAQELGIDIILDIVEPITIIKMDIIDLSRCLGIILDNAIESALESEKKVIDVALINKSNSVIIVVANTYKGAIPVLSKLFKEGFSTKGENRGLGLSNCKDIIGKYKNISLDTSITDVQFIQEITVSNK
ncbi:GHKL domain-containing protein [Clostridium estertheticum]|uniref:sensor histidine kinase n=1 Tax=Clostridium estertheticum TaxID=238834 RepID=UPI001CF3D092|nr:GHKL domain-containing protein [Clostridium estertheticum]MCB2309314.1 GHKL domain-containing protein [Clostridium estertheticum]MCB2347728.1 GHKL domain-containing protein [Clostridium estertheticum]MCB2352283.1 GHKL domain-containing protein [Clostridium estertheticum]WAG48277.1 GHKL domain-containing protein [Clostridium estertheticum]